MNKPKMKVKDFTITYCQIPYDDRYLIVKYHKKEICRFPLSLWLSEGDAMFWFLEKNNLYGLPDKFVGKIEEYNKYLDSQEDE